MSFPYPINTGIPFGTNNPADDVTPMRTNYANINGYLGVDHITPGSSGAGGNAGFHKQVTYNTENIPGGVPVNPSSIAFTANATSLTTQVVVPPATTNAQNFYQNANGIFPLSAVRAFGYLTIGGTQLDPTITIENAFNVASATVETFLNPNVQFTINLVPGALSSDNCAAFSAGATGSPVFSSGVWTGRVSFSVGFVSFVVLQI